MKTLEIRQAQAEALMELRECAAAAQDMARQESVKVDVALAVLCAGVVPYGTSIESVEIVDGVGIVTFQEPE